MWKFSHRLLSISGVIAFGISACTVIISTNGSTVKRVELTPANPTIVVGGAQQFILNAILENGLITQPSSALVMWTTSDPSVAAINAHGLATGIHAGMATITGTYGGESGSTTLTVTVPDLVKLRVDGSADKLEVTFPESRQTFLYVAHSANDSVMIYRVDAAGGEQRLQGAVSVIPGQQPGWLAIDPSGRFLYVANHGSGDISAFSIDRSSGRLADVPGSPFATGSGRWSVAVSPGGQFLSSTGLITGTVMKFRIDPDTGMLIEER